MRSISKSVVKPYPIVDKTNIINGFGRGSSDLGIPTANIPIACDATIATLPSGIYFGWCKLVPTNHDNTISNRPDGRQIEFNYGKLLKPEDLVVLPMVMSIGYNPFYQNKEKAAEIHIIHKFDNTFYGCDIKFAIAGYVRPELDYTTKEALIDDINLDISSSLEVLQLQEFNSLKSLIE